MKERLTPLAAFMLAVSQIERFIHHRIEFYLIPRHNQIGREQYDTTDVLFTGLIEAGSFCRGINFRLQNTNKT